MDNHLPNINTWPVKPTDFAPTTAPDYRINQKKPITDVYTNHQIPTEDSRYPWYSAVMSDGRYVTDYRNHCSANIPTGSQLKTRQWMTQNAESIINASRLRMAERSGYADINVVSRPGDEYNVECDTYKCARRNVAGSDTWATGDRRPIIVPELFGTYLIGPSIKQKAGNANVALTSRYEGGRNTPSHMRLQ